MIKSSNDQAKGMKFTNHFTKELKQLEDEDFFNAFHMAQISQNQKMLAIAEFRSIILVNLIKKQKVEGLLSKQGERIRFSNDSKFIIIGTYKGKCYLARSSNLKIVSVSKIHESRISMLKVLKNNQMLSCSSDLTIKLSDIFQKRELFQLKYHHVDSFDYDHNNQIVIISSIYNSIKFVRTNGSIVFNRKNSHKEVITTIQLVNDSTLLSASRDELKLWKINYGKNYFTQIRQLFNETNIYCAQSILNHSMIVKINSKSIQFLDYDLKIINQIMYSDEEKLISHENQLDTLNYVFLIGQEYVKVLKRIQ